MAIIPITKEHIDTVTLEMHPERMFSSSSRGGITGSVYVYANRSPFNRQRIESTPFDTSIPGPDDVGYNASGYETELNALVAGNTTTVDGTVVAVEDRSYAYESYLLKVNEAKVSPELNKFMEIWRFKPSFSFTSNTLRKNVVKDVLFKYYSGTYPQLDWAYSNYNCLTFFTASEITPNSALVYPAPFETGKLNQYINTSSFTISFWVNPRRSTVVPGSEYKAGTILHSSSSFAVSVVTGSEKDDYGNPEAFRIMLQLSQSADTAPSEVDLNGVRDFPRDLIFLSPDNSLNLNTWHHVFISWSANHNFGTGSIWIDNSDKTRTDFLVASSAINTSHVDRFTPLIVGNFYNGANLGAVPEMTQFFNLGASEAEGVPHYGAAAGEQIPLSEMNHKPNVDCHEIRIYNKFLAESERQECLAQGPQSLDNLMFYLPPFFAKESPYRTMQRTPYFTKMSASSEPFNTELSFGVGGHDLNIENFTRDFATGIYPRHFCLTSSIVTADTLYATANEINWDRNEYKEYFRARQLLLLPCDNGQFFPNFNLLASGTYSDRPKDGTPTDRFVDDEGYLDYSLVSLRNLVSTGSASDIDPGVNFDNTKANDIAEFLAGGSNYNPDFMTRDDDQQTPYELTVIQRTMDNSSNELYFFDASNLFYGNRIQPGSFVIEDTSLTGSSGAVGIKIVDNHQGNLYRADCKGDKAKWNSVGNILYDEGIVVIKSPNIPLFGQDQFKISFKGLHNVHTYEVNVMLSPNLFTSSSNPTFIGGKPNSYANTVDTNYVAFSSIQLHDDNLNVITRTNLAQPVVKKAR